MLPACFDRKIILLSVRKQAGTTGYLGNNPADIFINQCKSVAISIGYNSLVLGS